jgi:hypothetical protein
MSELVMYTIRVTHPKTKETMEFLGQGGTVAAALADGAKMINEPFRPSTSGTRHPPQNLKVIMPDGTIALKKLKEFETGGKPPAPEIEPP